VAQAAMSAARARFGGTRWALARFALYELTTVLHFVQPLCRLRGRLRHGLTLWRRRGRWRFALPRAATWSFGSDRGWPVATWLSLLEEQLRVHGVPLLRGGDFDRWDLEIRGGSLGRLRVRVATEDYGGGKQLVRFRVWPRLWAGLVVCGVLGALAMFSANDGAQGAAIVLSTLALLTGGRAYREAAAAMAEVRGAVDAIAEQLEPTRSPAAPEPLGSEKVPSAA